MTSVAGSSHVTVPVRRLADLIELTKPRVVAMVLVTTVLGLLTLLGGAYVFRRIERGFADVL